MPLPSSGKMPPTFTAPRSVRALCILQVRNQLLGNLTFAKCYELFWTVSGRRHAGFRRHFHLCQQWANHRSHYPYNHSNGFLPQSFSSAFKVDAPLHASISLVLPETVFPNYNYLIQLFLSPTSSPSDRSPCWKLIRSRDVSLGYQWPGHQFANLTVASTHEFDRQFSPASAVFVSGLTPTSVLVGSTDLVLTISGGGFAQAIRSPPTEPVADSFDISYQSLPRFLPP